MRFFLLFIFKVFPINGGSQSDLKWILLVLIICVVVTLIELLIPIYWKLSLVMTVWPSHNRDKHLVGQNRLKYTFILNLTLTWQKLRETSDVSELSLWIWMFGDAEGEDNRRGLELWLKMFSFLLEANIWLKILIVSQREAYFQFVCSSVILFFVPLFVWSFSGITLVSLYEDIFGLLIILQCLQIAKC